MGSEANYTALVCAFSGPVTLYTARECQPAWHKIAHQAGNGREALRFVATDGSGRMDAGALAERVQANPGTGYCPVLISATAGTTGAGMVDLLESCARIANDYAIWYHVDAAWGGPALWSDRLRGELQGLELTDSVIVDAHKWFATTMGCGMCITHHAPLLHEAFGAGVDFVPSTISSIDAYVNTVQWLRRFMGLRLFLPLAVAGWAGYGAHVERGVELFSHIRELLQSLGWSAVNDSKLAVLCVVWPLAGEPIREIVKRLLSSGRAWAAVAQFEGREVLRICATHGETTSEDVEVLVAALHAARHQLG